MPPNTQDQETGSPTPSGTSGTPQPPDTGGQGTGGNEGQGGGQGSDGTPPARLRVGDREFSTPQELAQYTESLTTMLREQGRALNDMATRNNGSQGVEPTGRPSEGQGGRPGAQPAGSDNANFWDDPVGVMRREMGAMIEPFRRDMIASQQVSAKQRLREEFAMYRDLEPMIDATIAQTGQVATYENLRATYFMVKGYLSETNQLPTSSAAAPAGDANAGTGAGSASNGPPQHRPSNAPIPAAPNAPRKRELTEDERRIARIGGYTDEQYLALIELDEEDVVTSKIGVPENG